MLWESFIPNSCHESKILLKDENITILRMIDAWEYFYETFNKYRNILFLNNYY